MTTILVAWDINRLIGKGKNLPWSIPQDLKLFQQRTKGNTVVFGSKTYIGLPSKPLKNRFNIVVAFPGEFVEMPNEMPANTSVSVVNGIKEAIDLSRLKHPDKEVFICGGASIYKQALEQNLINKMIVSVIPRGHDGDVYFPEFPGLWNRYVRETYEDFYVEEWVLEEK